MVLENISGFWMFLILLLGGLAVLTAIIFVIVMFIDMIKNRRGVWIALTIASGFSFIVALIYFFTDYKKSKGRKR